MDRARRDEMKNCRKERINPETQLNFRYAQIYKIILIKGFQWYQI